MYAIVYAYVTERNEPLNATVLSIEMTALFKVLRSEMKGMREIDSIIGVSGR